MQDDSAGSQGALPHPASPVPPIPGGRVRPAQIPGAAPRAGTNPREKRSVLDGFPKSSATLRTKIIAIS